MVVPPPVGAIGETVTSSMLWRYSGQLHVSVAVQARYILQSEAPATRTPVGDTNNLAAAADDVPYRQSCDVWLAGHCNVQPLGSFPKEGDAPVTTRLALARGSESLLDQRVRVMRGSNMGVAGYGPRRRSGGMADLVKDGVVELARSFDWTQLQASPPHLRVSHLVGDEILVLEGLLAQRPRLRCFLPGAMGAARVWPRGSHPSSEGHPIHLVADTLGIDSDTGLCAIVWRGSFPIPDVPDAERLILAAGVADGPAPLDWYEGWILGNAAAALGSSSLPSGTLEIPAYPSSERTGPFDLAQPGELRPADIDGAPWSERRPMPPMGATLDVEDTSDLAKEDGALHAALPFRPSTPEAVPESSGPITEDSPVAQTLDTEGPPKDPPPATPFAPRRR